MLGGREKSDYYKHYQVSDDEVDRNSNNSEDCKSYKSSDNGFVKNAKSDDDNESTNLEI